jgi:glycerophosphoryl diester phosphodiesterase
VPEPADPFAGLPRPIAIAHRGGAKEACENSPAAFQHAVDLGFPVVETDVRATIDGHALVFHDGTLDRTTDLAGPVAALPLRRIQRGRLANGEAPMALTEALTQWPHLRLNVDVKSTDAIGPFLAAVADTRAWDRVCAASFSTARLQRLRAMGGARLATSLGTGEVARLVVGRLPRTRAVAAQVPPRQGRVPLVTEAFVQRAHARGLQVHVWTIDDAPQMEQLLDLGVDGIVTDRPRVLREVLDRRAGGGG